MIKSIGRYRVMVLTGLVIGLLLSINLVGKEDSVIIDGFEDSESWETLTDGVKAVSSSGNKGKCMQIDYDLSDEGRNYVVVSKKFRDLKFPENFEVSFYIKGSGPDNNLEFKLVDGKGNVFWKKWESFVFPGDWEKITVDRDSITYAWGPDSNPELSKVESIELAVSKGDGGKGNVFIDELSFIKLPGKPADIKTEYKLTSSGIQNDRHPPELAMDGNMNTRWSSPSSDPQWLRIDMGEVKDISGLIIYWEAAFGKEYEVQLSNDDKKWNTVYTTTEGDGNSDEIFFEKQSARYIKIYGIERGTSWGYSIFEIKLVDDKQAPVVTASSNEKKAQRVLDGDLKTSWTASGGKNQSVIIDFKKSRKFGGVFIHWDEVLINHRKISVSEDKKKWKEVYSSPKEVDMTDYIYLDNPKGRYLKIEASAKKGRVSIKDISIKGPDEKLTTQRSYEIAAKVSPKGFYPRWLSREQEYWTIVGVTDDDEESLVSETGIVEPWHNSYMFSPKLLIDNKIVTWADMENVIQSLDDDYLPLPKVKWTGKDYDLIIDVFSGDAAQKSSTYMKYTVINKTKKNLEGEFYLLLRPFQVNPPWMHGGLAEVKSVEYDSASDSRMMKVNERNALFVPEKPDKYLTSKFKKGYILGDIIEDIAMGDFKPGVKNLEDSDGRASAALGYSFNIGPEQSRSYCFVVPLHGDSNSIDMSVGKPEAEKYFNTKREEVKNFWLEKLSQIKIDIADIEFINTLKSNVAYILINDDKNRLQPGSRCYEASWMRDGSVTVTAMLSMGYDKEVKRYLDWITGFVTEDGWVPFIVSRDDKIETHGWKEFDSQGQYIYAVFQYYLFEKDKKFLKDKKQKVIDVIKFAKARLDERRTPEYETPEKREFYGIFPESASHEGYIDPPRHSYWDDFWMLRGLNDAVSMFKVLGDKKMSKWADEERKTLQKDFYDSINLVAKKKEINYIAGCADLGDFDATSTAIGMWPCNEMKNMPKELMKNTFDRYWDELKKRFGEWKGGFTPYEMRNANAFVMLGQRDKLHEMLMKFFEWKRPRTWNHWAEVVTSDYRLAQYLGDMPHTWIGAGYVNVIRNMFMWEEGDVLYLGKGIAEEWVEPGKNISVTEMPTHFGKISYTLNSGKKEINIKVTGNLSGMEKIVFIVPPVKKKVSSVKVNGKEYKDPESGEIAFKKLPAEIVILY